MAVRWSETRIDFAVFARTPTPVNRAVMAFGAALRFSPESSIPPPGRKVEHSDKPIKALFG
jgi:hypothetical protein